MKTFTIKTLETEVVENMDIATLSKKVVKKAIKEATSSHKNCTIFKTKEKLIISKHVPSFANCKAKKAIPFSELILTFIEKNKLEGNMFFANESAGFYLEIENGSISNYSGKIGRREDVSISKALCDFLNKMSSQERTYQVFSDKEFDNTKVEIIDYSDLQKSLNFTNEQYLNNDEFRGGGIGWGVVSSLIFVCILSSAAAGFNYYQNTETNKQLKTYQVRFNNLSNDFRVAQTDVFKKSKRPLPGEIPPVQNNDSINDKLMSDVEKLKREVALLKKKKGSTVKKTARAKPTLKFDFEKIITMGSKLSIKHNKTMISLTSGKEKIFDKYTLLFNEKDKTLTVSSENLVKKFDL